MDQTNTSINPLFDWSSPFSEGWCHKEYEILVSPSGIRPSPPPLEAQTLNHWTTWEVPVFSFWIFLLPLFDYNISGWLEIYIASQQVDLKGKKKSQNLKLFQEI